MRTCSIEECPNKHRAKGLCAKHYYRQRDGVHLTNPRTWVRQTTTTPNPRAPAYTGPCTYPGCSTVSKTLTMCGKHHQRATAHTTYDESDVSVVSICKDCDARAIHFTRTQAMRDAIEHQVNKHERVYRSVSA